MKKIFVILILTTFVASTYSQNSEKLDLEKWIEKNKIVFNSPTCPNGFEHFLNCQDIHAFRKVVGDTIIVYSRGGSIAENIESLNKSIKEERFNVYRYPTYSQDNGTIVVQNMRKWVFIARNDSLYLLDEFDERKNEEYIKIMDSFFKKRITESEYKKQVEENEKKDFGFVPRFKLIYFNGIFENSKEYKFERNQNFREERVTLLKSWKQDKKTFYEINLKTWTAGRYVLSDDFKFINTELCKD